MIRHSGPRSGHSYTTANARSLSWPAVMPYARGLQPPPQDKKKLKRECTRLAWAIHCLQNSRAKLVLLLDRKTTQLHRLRREHDDLANALQDMDTQAFDDVEAQRREWDDPIRALQWAQKTDIDDVT